MCWKVPQHPIEPKLLQVIVHRTPSHPNPTNSKAIHPNHTHGNAIGITTTTQKDTTAWCELAINGHLGHPALCYMHGRALHSRVLAALIFKQLMCIRFCRSAFMFLLYGRLLLQADHTFTSKFMLHPNMCCTFKYVVATYSNAAMHSFGCYT